MHGHCKMLLAVPLARGWSPVTGILITDRDVPSGKQSLVTFPNHGVKDLPYLKDEDDGRLC